MIGIAKTSKLKLFMTLFNNFKMWTNVIKNSILHELRALDKPLQINLWLEQFCVSLSFNVFMWRWRDPSAWMSRCFTFNRTLFFNMCYNFMEGRQQKLNKLPRYTAGILICTIFSWREGNRSWLSCLDIQQAF